jgi:hypothetical protein
MCSSRNFVVALVLAASVLFAVNAKADVIKFTFGPAPKNANSAELAEGGAVLSLTAQDNGQGGVDFVFASTLKVGQNGGPG